MLLVGFYLIFLLVQDVFRNYREDQIDDQWSQVASQKFTDHLIALSLFGIPLIWWHLIDLFDKFECRQLWLRLLLSYGNVATVLTVGLTGAALIFSGVTEQIECRGLKLHTGSEGNTWGTACTPTAGYGFEYPVILPTLLLILLATAKTIRLVAGQIEKAR